MGEESSQLILGIDGGATKTAWVLCEKQQDTLQLVVEGRLGPGSMKLLDAAGLQALLTSLPREAACVGVHLAGCATAQDRADLHKIASSIWPHAKICAGSDRESSYAAAFGKREGIVVMAGTGSAVTGQKNGVEDRAGGWGHLLGDSGGGYDLAIHALRGVLFDFDTRRSVSPVAQTVLRTLGLNTLRELTEWAQGARKSDLARLTPLIFECADDPPIAGILAEGARALAALTAAVAERLDFSRPPVRLTGSVFLKQPRYVKLFTEALAEKCPGSTVEVCETPSCLGSALLAAGAGTLAASQEPPQADDLRHAATEQSNPRSIALDLKSTQQLVELFVGEEHCVEQALTHAVAPLIRAVDLVAECLGAGGRLFYVGAGTSGRLGVLDASEIPPTFGLPPDRVQALIAGGASAILQSAEGAEDHASAGAQAIRERGVTPGDVVCGITASGRTPFVVGALQAAQEIGSRTILLTCNPARSKARLSADVEIDLPTGAELITGSTRLKAGTATKVALNILTSCSLIRLGRVSGNAMSCLRATNKKLRDRATRIVASRLQIDEENARKRLRCANWNISAALDSAPEKPRSHRGGASG